MNNPEVKLHYYQKQLLKKLTTTTKGLKFNDLLLDGLESEHMNYHLKKLVEFKLVEKDGTLYVLTDSGKDYVNLLDDQIEIVEKQPKTSIIIRGVRVNPVTGELEHLLMRRLRQPYYGKVGRMTGKVRFGETLQQAAERELFEECGLKARSFALEQVYHKMRYRPDGTFVQDVIFYLFCVQDFEGTLIEKSDIQENFWISSKDVKAGNDLDLYDDFELIDQLEPREFSFVENIAEAEGF